MDAYGLRDTVTHDSGDWVPIHADAVARYRAGERILYYTYTPLWLNRLLVPGEDVEWLEVPEVGDTGQVDEGGCQHEPARRSQRRLVSHQHQNHRQQRFSRQESGGQAFLLSSSTFRYPTSMRRTT